jgi:hypothetical protein
MNFQDLLGIMAAICYAGLHDNEGSPFNSYDSAVKDALALIKKIRELDPALWETTKPNV